MMGQNIIKWDRMELLEANNIITRVRISIYSSNKRLNLTKESLVDWKEDERGYFSTPQRDKQV